MSKEGYKLPENNEVLKNELDKIDKRITALWDIARQLKNTEFNDKAKDLFEDYESMEENSSRDEIGYEKVLSRMTNIIQGLREVAVETGLTADLTDEGLDSQWKMIQAEDDEEVKRIRMSRNSGKSPEEVILEGFFKEKPKHYKRCSYDSVLVFHIILLLQ